MDFVRQLTSSEQACIAAILEDTILTLEEKLDVLNKTNYDEQVKEKCKALLCSQDKLNVYLSKVPIGKKEIVRSLLTNELLDLAEKLTVFQGIAMETKLSKEGLDLLVNMESLKPNANVNNKAGRLRVPVITEFPFLDKLSDRRNRKAIKSILIEDGITALEKKQKLSKIVTEKNDFKECRRFLREMEKENHLLDQLPEVSRAEVAAIFRESAMNFSDKRESLRFALTDPEDRRKCREYLKEKISSTPITAEEANEMGAVNMDLFESCPDVMNILILGETGVGKSTFINGLANYLKYGTMHEAMNKKVKGKQRKITCKARDNNENETLEGGKSATVSAMPYAFQWGPRGHEKMIRLIDTPGVGDVAGFQKDKVNFENIFARLADYPEFHAICILLKPNESKLTSNFTYCLGELLSRLHISARKNILICFTSTRNTLYVPGDTLSTLRAYVKEIGTRGNIDIQFNRSTLFCFDNESFRFLCAYKDGMTFPPDHISNYNGSWRRSVGETFRLFTRISQLHPHNVADTLTVYNMRRVFDLLAHQKALKEKTDQDLQKVIDELNAEKENMAEEITKLEARLHTNQTIVVRRPAGQIYTVCASDKCSQIDGNNVAEKHYAQCHKNCECVKAKLEVCKEVALQRCACINQDTLTCTVCDCHWMTHMQIDYNLICMVQQIVDPIAQGRIEKLKQEKKVLELKISNAWVQTNGTHKPRFRREVLVDAELAVFLKKNSILPYNPHKKEYLEKLINEERQKSSPGKLSKDLSNLEHALDDHCHQVAAIEACKAERAKPVEELEAMVNHLRVQNNNSDTQADLGKIVWLKVRNREMMRSTVVNLNDGWINSHLQ